MKQGNLGRLEKVDIREVFATEAGDFTPWLAQEENLKLLGETIGVDLALDAQEKDVGQFRADILCKDATTDSWVLIENQIERTDHTHLGQLLTYAAGLQAVTVVWIAERFTEEHRATLDWLNERTDEQINCFGLEIELWRIGDSPPAPKFNIVSQPNDWSRAVKAAAGESNDITEHKQKQFQFWMMFKEFMEKNSRIRCQKAYPQHCMNHSIGRSGFHLASIVSLWNSVSKNKDPEVRVELVLTGEDAKSHFEAILARREEIEKAVDAPLTWHNPAGKNMCRVYIRRNADFLDEKLWSQQHEWLREKLELFHKVFAPIIQGLETIEYEDKPE
ncbi:MAG: DUF4268 domain-containing protein [Elusimicrobia bacterium HGW-Elusimicrobia-1]|nr:MAG: DUF4268 domain-containing protein [Elusimicrobia bacterium HGW-Elusimicrobia-1]